MRRDLTCVRMLPHGHNVVRSLCFAPDAKGANRYLVSAGGGGPGAAPNAPRLVAWTVGHIHSDSDDSSNSDINNRNNSSNSDINNRNNSSNSDINNRNNSSNSDVNNRNNNSNSDGWQRHVILASGSAALSLASLGGLLLTGTQGGGVLLHEVGTWEPLGNLQGHAAPVLAVAFVSCGARYDPPPPPPPPSARLGLIHPPVLCKGSPSTTRGLALVNAQESAPRPTTLTTTATAMPPARSRTMVAVTTSASLSPASACLPSHPPPISSPPHPSSSTAVPSSSAPTSATSSSSPPPPGSHLSAAELMGSLMAMPGDPTTQARSSSSSGLLAGDSSSTFFSPSTTSSSASSTFSPSNGPFAGARLMQHEGGVGPLASGANLAMALQSNRGHLGRAGGLNNESRSRDSGQREQNVGGGGRGNAGKCRESFVRRHRAVSSSSDRTVRVWCLHRLSCLQTIALDHVAPCLGVGPPGTFVTAPMQPDLNVAPPDAAGLWVWTLAPAEVAVISSKVPPAAGVVTGTKTSPHAAATPVGVAAASNNSLPHALGPVVVALGAAPAAAGGLTAPPANNALAHGHRGVEAAAPGDSIANGTDGRRQCGNDTVTCTGGVYGGGGDLSLGPPGGGPSSGRGAPGLGGGQGPGAATGDALPSQGRHGWGDVAGGSSWAAETGGVTAGRNSNVNNGTVTNGETQTLSASPPSSGTLVPFSPSLPLAKSSLSSSSSLSSPLMSLSSLTLGRSATTSRRRWSLRYRIETVGAPVAMHHCPSPAHVPRGRCCPSIQPGVADMPAEVDHPLMFPFLFFCGAVAVDENGIVAAFEATTAPGSLPQIRGAAGRVNKVTAFDFRPWAGVTELMARR
eukprot:jgi/Mesvir1/14913/Mv05508-RA.1